jgi:alkylated DNA repair dioxygenase AlkB
MPSARSPERRPELPEGLLYQEEFLAKHEEEALLAEIRALPLEEAKYKAFRAKRRTVSYGTSYDFDTNKLSPAPPIAPFLFPLRKKVAGLVETEEASFTHALVTEYRPGTELGWHRDVGEFGVVVGVSLAGTCRMRFRRYPPEKGARVFNLDLAPRSVYVLRDEIRWRWQHSVARTRELRYSITFRTPR